VEGDHEHAERGEHEGPGLVRHFEVPPGRGRRIRPFPYDERTGPGSTALYACLADALFAVIREAGPAWDRSRAMREQDAWDEHAAFMDGLARDGFIVEGGPLGDGSRALHVVESESEEAVRQRFADDPWEPPGLFRVASVERWQILLRR
ncbi:MAG: YciI family protein, partial [Thermoleophilaceae bacterium]